MEYGTRVVAHEQEVAARADVQPGSGDRTRGKQVGQFGLRTVLQEIGGLYVNAKRVVLPQRACIHSVFSYQMLVSSYLYSIHSPSRFLKWKALEYPFPMPFTFSIFFVEVLSLRCP